MTAMCLGIVDRCLEEAVRYATAREQWAQAHRDASSSFRRSSRGSDPGANIDVRVASPAARGRGRGSRLATPEASASKLYCARSATGCALDAVQVMGGAGYMPGSVVEMMARDAKLFPVRCCTAAESRFCASPASCSRADGAPDSRGPAAWIWTCAHGRLGLRSCLGLSP